MGGQSFSASRSQRAQALSNSFPTIREEVRAPRNRLVRINRRLTPPSLPIKTHAPGFRRNRRVHQELGSRELKLLPSGRSLGIRDQKDIVGQRSGNSHCASLANPNLVASTSRNARERCFPAPTGCAQTTGKPTRAWIGLAIRSLPNAVERSASASSAVASAWQRVMGIGPEAEGAVKLPHAATAATTRETRNSNWRQFCKFCIQRRLSPLSAEAAAVVKHLWRLWQRGTVRAASLQPHLSAINKRQEEFGLKPPAKGHLIQTARRVLRVFKTNCKCPHR